MPAAPMVVLTREREDNLALAERLRAAGVEAIDYPCIATRIIPYAGGPVCGRELESFKVVSFSSKRGVAGMAEVAERVRAGAFTVAAVGETTAAALEKLLGRKADIVAEPPTGEGLAQAIIAKLAPATLLSVGGNKTTGALKRLLEANGFQVCELAVYENFRPQIAPLELDRSAIAVFASPSAAEAFFEVNGRLKEKLDCVAIGPTTAKALLGLGAKKILTASKPTDEELFRVIVKLTESGGG